jgi:hypothetical protein
MYHTLGYYLYDYTLTVGTTKPCHASKDTSCLARMGKEKIDLSINNLDNNVSECHIAMSMASTTTQ